MKFRAGWFEGKKNRRHVLTAVVLLAVCFLTYSNSLHNGFLLDDHDLIESNAQIRSAKFFMMSLTPTVASGDTRPYYRPVPHALIMLNYLLFGKNPWGYHLVNLFFFYMCSVALYGLLNLLFDDWKISFLTSLFFCVHPINGMLVNYMTATGYSVMIASMIFSLIFYLLAEAKRKRVYYFISLIWFFIALLCHEIVLIFPLYLAAVLFFIKKYPLKQIVFKSLPYGAVSFVYFLFRLQFVSLKSSIIDKISIFNMSIAEYTASFAQLILGYLARLISLQDIALNWVIPIVRENSFWWAVGLLMVFLFCVYLIFAVWKGGVKAFALSWFLIGFLPVTMASFIHPVSGLALEPHWLIFSSVGFFLFLAKAFCFMHTRKGLMPVMAGLLVVFYILDTREYNYLWADEKRYCQYWLKVFPQNLNGKFFLANAYLYDKEFDKAKEIYLELLSKHWDSPKIYNNLGLIEYAQKNSAKAVEYFRKSLDIRPGAVAYTNLGAALADLKDEKAAEEAYLKAIELNNFFIEPQFNLAAIYWEQKGFGKASHLLEHILSINPMDELSMFLLAELSLINGEKKRALELTKHLLEKSQNPQRLVKLGSRFAEHRFSNMAFALYSKALKVDSCYKEAYIEMGKVFGNRDQFYQAMVMWREGLKCHPGEKILVDLISEAQELLKAKRVEVVEGNSTGRP